MDNQIASAFLELMDSIIDDKLADMDTVELCQIVSNNQGTGTYNIKLMSDENTVIRDVVNCSKFSFTNGDYAYIMKLKNKLSNCFIVASNKTAIENKESIEKVVVQESSNQDLIEYSDGDNLRY